MLGYAMLLLHETPVLTRAAIRKALDLAPTDATGSILPTTYQSLRAAALADQYEQIKITPQVMNTEELSKLWTAIQSHFRPTAVYLATVAMIEPQAAQRRRFPSCRAVHAIPSRSAKRVQPCCRGSFLRSQCSRRSRCRRPASPPNSAIRSRRSEPGSGEQASSWWRSNAVRGFTLTLTPASNAGDLSASFLVPNDPINVAAGTYSASLSLGRPGDGVIVATNSLPFSIAPQIVSISPTAKLAADGSLTLTPTCAPQVQSTQDISIILNDQSVPANAFTGGTATPTFVFPSLAPGAYWVRLRVDGVDSPLVVAGSPPSFAGPQIVVTT
jgi:Pvc16 N-terminal domain